MSCDFMLQAVTNTGAVSARLSSEGRTHGSGRGRGEVGVLGGIVVLCAFSGRRCPESSTEKHEPMH